MHIYFNELSIDKQFSDVSEFHQSIKQLLSMRALARQQMQTEIRCYRVLLTDRKITSTMTVHDAVQNAIFDKETKRSLMSWLTKGPFWDYEEREHYSDRWLQVDKELVTDTAIGEAGWCSMWANQSAYYLMSVVPSRWEYSPIRVDLIQEGTKSGVEKFASVINVWDQSNLTEVYKSLGPTYRTWNQLEDHCKRVYKRLRFADDCFRSMDGIPFSA